MVKVATYFGMAFGAFVFWQTMDKVHVWIALHQDEKKERLEREAEIRKMREELLKQARENNRLPYGDMLSGDEKALKGNIKHVWSGTYRYPAFIPESE